MVMSASNTAYHLNLTVVYDNAASLARASQLCERVTRLLGPDALNVAAWKIRDLDHSEVLPQAVEAATKADVILVALSAQTALPILFCVWIDLWLPRRDKCSGALVGLLNNVSPVVEQYLRAVARRADLDLFLHQDTVREEVAELPGHRDTDHRLQPANSMECEEAWLGFETSDSRTRSFVLNTDF
jgi:hypothetical protein